MLEQADINADEWAVLGKAVLRVDNGKPYLTPDRVREISDVDMLPLAADRVKAIAARGGADQEARIAQALADARRRLEVKMLAYVADQTSFAVLKTDARTRRYTTGGQRSGTLAGEAVRAWVAAEMIGISKAQSLICFRIFASHASPPTSSFWSNHTSTPAARRASAIRFAASASWEA